MTSFSRVFRLSVLAFLFFCCAAAEAAPEPRAFLKTDYASIAQVSVPAPNVLFLLDTGSPMVFSPKGIMPLRTDGYSQWERAQLLKDCTYGTGTRPMNESNQYNYFRYGRDLDNSNNRIGDPDCYYTSDPSKPYFLTFKNSAYHVNPPSGVNVGDVITGYPKYKDSPYASQPFSPSQQVYEQLVPNDSRMYMMKLVLWRLTGAENARLFSRMNVAMATSYQEDSVGGNYEADFYRHAPYGRNGSDTPYGSAPGWSLGRLGNYKDADIAKCGVLRHFYDYSKGTPQWYRVNRAVLKVPFDKFYVERAGVPGTYDPTPNLSRFRRYIDGVETTNSSEFTNPELFADGQTPLSTSLYGRDGVGHNDTDGNKLIQYAPQVIAYGEDKIDKLNLKEYSASTHTERLVSGQAVGSAIDFFAPRTSGGLSDGLAFSTGKAGYFPVTGSCQSNWVVIFTAGNDESNAPRTAAAAALELYKNTLRIRGREKWNNAWREKEYAMDKGVRTLVVGFVDPGAIDPNSVKLRKSLNDIAAHGQPKRVGGQWVKDETRTALFANDVPGLINALNEVFSEIDAESRPAPSGAPLIQLDQAAGATGKLFNASYTSKAFDQWFSRFSCKVLKFDTITNETRLEEKWEAGSRMQAVGQNRPLYASKGAEGDMSQVVGRLKTFSSSEFQSLAQPPSRPDDFRNWLISFPRPTSADPTPLGDMQSSNFLTVGSENDEVVFLHTNRGTLHVLDVETGDEIWGFIPPSVLQGRARVMKYKDGTGMWYNGDGRDSRRSMPVTLLDGLLTDGIVSDDQKHVLVGTMGNGGNGLYAMDISTIRSAPAFLWAVDNVRYDTAETPPIKGVRRWGLAAESSPGKNFDYSDLGLTIQALNFCNISEDFGAGRTVGILPGGVGYNLGADSQGKAIFVVNPKDGQIYKKLDDSALIHHLGKSAPLGMAIAPLTLIKLKRGNRILTEFFTADSEGNVLSCDVAGKKVSDWKLKSLFRLTTVAANGVLEGKPVAIPKALLKLRRKFSRNSVLIGGTCDVLAPGSGTDPTRRVHNEQQFIFCLQLDRLAGTETTKDLRPLVSEDINIEWKDPGDISPTEKGWALRLKAEDNRNEAEFVTTAPYFYEGKLVVTTYIPQKISQDVCVVSERGVGRVYILDVDTGKATFKPILVKNVKLTGVTGVRGRLLFSAEEKRSGALKEAEAEFPEVRRLDQNLMEIRLPREGDLPLNPGSPYVDYWRDFDSRMLDEMH